MNKVVLVEVHQGLCDFFSNLYLLLVGQSISALNNIEKRFVCVFQDHRGETTIVDSNSIEF